jgi:hypothetical protein
MHSEIDELTVSNRTTIEPEQANRLDGRFGKDSASL